MSATASLLLLSCFFAFLIFIFRQKSNYLSPNHDFSNTVKGIAMLMILYHHVGIYHSKEFWFLFLSGWCFNGVSLFFFISAFGLMQSFRMHNYSYSVFFRRRFLSLFPTIFICMTLRIALNPLYTYKFSWPSDIFYYFGLNEWYIFAIIILYFLFINIARNTKNNINIIYLHFIFSISIWIILLITAEQYNISKLWSRFPFSFTCGICFSLYYDKIIKFLNKYLTIHVFSSLIIYALTIYLIDNLQYIYPILDLITPYGAISLLLLSNRFSFHSEFISWIGSHSLSLYLLQVPLIKYGIFINVWEKNAIGILATLVIIFILSSFIFFLNEKFSFLFKKITKI